MNPVKPGYLTTEFWLHGGMQIISLLVIVGFVNAGDGTALSDSWAKSVGAAATLITNLVGFYLYIRSRTAVKVAAGNAEAAAGTLSPTSFHSNAAILVALGLSLFAAPAFAQAPLKAIDRPPIITTASNQPAYFLPWRAWMHGQLGNNQQPQQPIIINQPQPAAPNATDPTVIALLQQQVQLHQQQVFLQQQIASLMSAGVGHLSAPAPVVPPPIYYPAPQGVQPFPSAPPAPVQPIPVAPQYPVQPLPVAPVAPVQPLPLAPPVNPQVLPVAPITNPPRPLVGPQAIPIGPTGNMPPQSSYNRFTTLTHAICAPVK